MHVGDSVSIQVVDQLNENSLDSPMQIRAEELESIIEQAKLKSYYALQQELREKGLIDG